MKTQNELEVMSDRELEFELGLLAFHPKESGEHVIPRYCSSPNDIMPLVIKSDLCFLPCDESYHITAPYRVSSWKDVVTHANVYRAATIVLILLLQGEVK